MLNKLSSISGQKYPKTSQGSCLGLHTCFVKVLRIPNIGNDDMDTVCTYTLNYNEILNIAHAWKERGRQIDIDIK